MFDVFPVIRQFLSGDLYCACGGIKNTTKDIDSGGFSCTVRAQKAKDLSFGNDETDPA